MKTQRSHRSWPALTVSSSWWTPLGQPSRYSPSWCLDVYLYRVYVSVRMKLSYAQNCQFKSYKLIQVVPLWLIPSTGTLDRAPGPFLSPLQSSRSSGSPGQSWQTPWWWWKVGGSAGWERLLVLMLYQGPLHEEDVAGSGLSLTLNISGQLSPTTGLGLEPAWQRADSRR